MSLTTCSITRSAVPSLKAKASRNFETILVLPRLKHSHVADNIGVGRISECYDEVDRQIRSRVELGLSDLGEI